MMLPTKVVFCQMVLLPTGKHDMTGGVVLGGLGRGADGGVNQEMGFQGNGDLVGWGTGPAH